MISLFIVLQWAKNMFSYVILLATHFKITDLEVRLGVTCMYSVFFHG